MARLAYPTQLRDHLGNEVRLPPKPFAIGGEGAVFDVLGRDDLVAKLYNKPQSRERCEKLRAMARLWKPDLLKIAAWPTATLSNGHGSTIEGILMPKIAGYVEVHHLYSVAQRKKAFPEADWGFLLHTARNCAIAFESVHAHGHVVGDVNQKNVMVSKKGLVALVDCDSFQVADGPRIFRCEVGVPEYTPPELQGKGFATLDRAPNHDLFGLAVLVFHLLMIGRHPFSGVPLTPADIPIEKAIRDGCYAYTQNTATARLRPPPHVPPMMMLDPATLDLFERAFCTPRRPTATEWRTSLDAAMKQLVRCKNDSKHAYLTAADYCPWCELIAKARLMFFLPSQSGTSSFSPEDVEQLIQKLDGMVLCFDPYVRPQPKSPVAVSIPTGLCLLKKPVPGPYPPPPTQAPRPVLIPLPVKPPPLPMPLPLPLPTKPQPVSMPPLMPLPETPPPLSKPVLLPMPTKPQPTIMPSLVPLPLPPSPVPKPPLLPLPTPPEPVGEPPLTPYPELPQIQKPALLPHPPAPFDPPLPKLQPLPAPPDYPDSPQPGAPDHFFRIVCKVGVAAGIPILIGAPPVGVAMIVGFAVWWLIILATENLRQENARRRLKKAHQIDCDLIDDAYDELCRSIEEANEQQMAAWRYAKAAQEKRHARACNEIDNRNEPAIAAFQKAEAAAKVEHAKQCRKIDASNSKLLADWEAMNSEKMAEYVRKQKEIEAKNRPVLMEWEAENAHREARFRRACEEVRTRNQELLAAWETTNAAQIVGYEQEREKIEFDNNLMVMRWEIEESSRYENYRHTCGEIDGINQARIVAWQAANAEMMAEYERECGKIETKNRQAWNDWVVENTNRQSHHERTCREIELKNQELIAPWKALNSARQSEHERACRQIEVENERAIAAWKAANAPWVEEEQRWRKRLAAAEAERNRLESELQAQRTASQSLLDKCRQDAQKILSSHWKVRLDYRRELHQAAADSKKIQLEEHLDKALIRDVRIPGISSRLVLALEFFGIESARDVEMLKTQKVPGIGPVLCNRLFEWRENVERTFVYQQTLPESERSRIANKYAPVFLPLGQTVQAAIRDLEAIASSHRARERELVKAIESAVQDAAVASAHLDALHRML